MLSDKFILDEDPSSDSNNYKSCFARSIVVNSQHTYSGGHQQLHSQETMNKVNLVGTFLPESTSSPVGRLRRDSFLSDSRRSSLISRRSSSVCSSRIAEMPVGNLVLKSQIETLQWQLKQTEESREMYKAVMKEVVGFLERAHRSLQMLGCRNVNESVTRTLSDYNIVGMHDENSSVAGCEAASSDYATFKDCTWRRQKKQPPEETPPEKLSQEAFRLLRTAQSLLNTGAPDLAHLNVDTSADLQFLEQLAKEFPRAHQDDTESLSLSSLQFTTPSDKDTRISTALNRKLSLQHNSDYRSSLNFSKSEKNQSPISSVSSAEDESGFSSMNSFQELGIPIKDTSALAKGALLNSMLQEGAQLQQPKPKELKLWQKPSTSHRRWSSIPIETRIEEKEPLKVLWV